MFAESVDRSQCSVCAYQADRLSKSVCRATFLFPCVQGGPGNPAQKQLNGLFNSIASFYHPSNNGRWLVGYSADYFPHNSPSALTAEQSSGVWC